MQSITVLFLSLSLSLPAVQASELAGTWQRESTEFSAATVPTLTIEKAADGLRMHWSTGPAYDAKLDGKAHPSPSASVSEMTIFRRVDGRTIEQTLQRGGQDIGRIIFTVSPDGGELHQNSEGKDSNGRSYSADSYFKRAGGKAPDEPFAGVWRTDPSRSRSSNPIVYTIADVENGLQFRSSVGLNYTALFDGKPYPVTQTQQKLTVTLERVNERTVRATFKNESGKVTRTSTLAVGPDGKLTSTDDISNPNGSRLNAVGRFTKR